MKKSSSSNFISQLNGVRVHDLNSLLTHEVSSVSVCHWEAHRFLRSGCSHRSVRGYILEKWLLTQISQGVYSWEVAAHTDQSGGISLRSGCSHRSVGVCPWGLVADTDQSGVYPWGLVDHTDQSGVYPWGLAAHTVRGMSLRTGCSCRSVGGMSLRTGCSCRSFGRMSLRTGCSHRSVGDMSFRTGCSCRSVGGMSLRTGCSYRSFGGMSLRTGCLHRSVGGMSLRTGCLASSHGLVSGSCCESIALDGHPTPPQCQEQLVHICRVLTAPWTCLPNSSQMCSIWFKVGTGRDVDCALSLSAQLVPDVFR